MAKKFDSDKQKKFPKPGLDQDFSRLIISLNQSDAIKKNPALYQTILYLIRNSNLAIDKIWKYIEDIIDEIENSSSTDSADYVVLSDGGVDNPTQPINNGAGQFIYVAYTP